jgi:hypothetical protein
LPYAVVDGGLPLLKGEWSLSQPIDAVGAVGEQMKEKGGLYWNRDSVESEGNSEFAGTRKWRSTLWPKKPVHQNRYFVQKPKT